MTDKVQLTCCAEATVSTCTCELGLPHSLHMAVFSMTQTHSGATLSLDMHGRTEPSPRGTANHPMRSSTLIPSRPPVQEQFTSARLVTAPTSPSLLACSFRCVRTPVQEKRNLCTSRRRTCHRAPWYDPGRERGHQGGPGGSSSLLPPAPRTPASVLTEMSVAAPLARSSLTHHQPSVVIDLSAAAPPGKSSMTHRTSQPRET